MSSPGDLGLSAAPDPRASDVGLAARPCHKHYYTIKQFYRRTNFVGDRNELHRWNNYRWLHRRTCSTVTPFLSLILSQIKKTTHRRNIDGLTDGYARQKKKFRQEHYQRNQSISNYGIGGNCVATRCEKPTDNIRW